MSIATIDLGRTNGHAPPPSATPDPIPAKIADLGGGVAGAVARRADNASNRTFATLIALACLVVLAAFGLSFHGLYEFGRVIVHLPHEAALTVPLALDLFSLVAMFAAFVTHDAPLRVRAYCWGIIVGTVGVSMVANGIYQAYVLETAGSTEYAVAAVSLAALWPTLTALSLHLIIVARRHLARRRVAAEAAVVRAEELAEEPQRARAVVMAFNGATVAAIAEELGVPARTAARWTVPVRDALAALAASRATAPEPESTPAAKTPRRTRNATASSTTRG